MTAMPRWRNVYGNRIRLETGERMNDDECCCDDTCTACVDNQASLVATVSLEGFNSEGLSGCDDCPELDGDYVVSFTSTAFTCDGKASCIWFIDLGAGSGPQVCDLFGEGYTLRVVRLFVINNGDGTYRIRVALVFDYFFFASTQAVFVAFEDEYGGKVDCIDGVYTLPLDTDSLKVCSGEGTPQAGGFGTLCNAEDVICEVSFG